MPTEFSPDPTRQAIGEPEDIRPSGPPAKPVAPHEHTDFPATSGSGPHGIRRPLRDEAADIARFIADIQQNAAGLIDDHAERGDVKLIARVVQELRDSFKFFAKYRQFRKVTVFGSARTPPDHPRYQLAVAFGRAMAEAGYMIITGAGPGIMEAGHVGASAEMSVGLNITLPFEQGANAVIAADEKLLIYNYFFTRKLFFLKEAHALVLFPGGFGTLDEGFEVLTMIQTGKTAVMPVVMVDVPGGHFWEHWVEHVQQHLFREGMISEQDFDLFRVVHSVPEAVREITDFYRVYHSQRYVRGSLSLRLRQAVSDELLAKIRGEFSDILSSGDFKRGVAHTDEFNEPQVINLPRLYFRFNRKAHGRLRQLINLINQEG